ncbi:hypothetical protein PFTANZ_06458, partial [Plasmodium falciparum Tanzania (2000708)]
MAPTNRGGDSARDARDILEEYGKKVQQIAHREAQQRSKRLLKGILSQATYSRKPIDKETPSDPCKLDHEKHTNVTNGNSHPCGNGTKERFSDVRDGECDKNKISGSNDNEGACAPLRRLHLCVTNLENIYNYENINKDTLLAEVCLAAKHEGESLVKEYKEHKKKNRDFNICTALARSFADIGDIIRGKDLFVGYNETDKLQKVILQQRLKEIFKKIHGELRGDAKTPYESDENYYKLREDWWNANRKEVWKAITCGATMNDIFSKNIRNSRTTLFDYNCGHHKDNNVPTNLDYVPQHLRWFEEWAEDFCRKRKKQLTDAIKNCRYDERGEPKYCSLNGYDCTTVFQKKDSCSSDSNCTACSNICIPYDAWLRNQRNEFEKQKDKYDKEIKTYVNKTPISNSNSNTKKEYYKEFYDELEKQYESVDTFLHLLNNGRYCKEGVKGESPINFNGTGNTDAFDRSKYCQPCPNCVVVCDNKECKEKTGDDKCRSKIIQKILEKETPTPIKVVFSGDGKGVITEKLDDFCKYPNNDKGKNYKEWKCYNKNKDYNNCEMNISSYKDPTDPNVMLSIKCFDSWARNLLVDALKWEHQLKNCINNTNVTDCESKCNNNCKCYEEWIKRKGHEWKQVKGVIENNDEGSHNYYKNVKNLFYNFLYPVIYKLEKEEKNGKWDQFMEDLKKKIEASEKNTRTRDSQDAIELLLDHLKDNAITCKDNNSLEEDKNCTRTKSNPCIRNANSSKPPKTVKHIAEMMQRRAREQLEAGAGEIKLKGDATKGTYGQGGHGDVFKDVCNITANHSNSTYQFSNEPCGGKGTGDGINTRFVLETQWQPDEQYMRDDHKDVLIPPRRRHICTSNLEYLQTKDKPLNGNDGADKVNHSFLGDVLLSAKSEAQNIIDTYKRHNGAEVVSDPKHQETMCRAIRYSFADLGDIIRGRDIWDREPGMNFLQGYLKDVFDNIRTSLTGKGIKTYDKDKDHIKIREDWWEANRHQVWRAMKCATQDIKNMKCNGIPIEDYIPQRLRWMTEFAEWYVKFKSKVNKECKSRVFMTLHHGKKSTEDTSKCKEYKDKIEEWKGQWKKLGTKYSLLYGTAKVNAFKEGRDGNKIEVKEKDKSVYDFLFNLHVHNGGNVDPSSSTKSTRSTRPKRTITDTKTPYDNAGAYVNDTVDLSDSKYEREFCDRGKTFKPSDQPSPTSTDDDTATPEEDEGKTEEDEEEEEEEEEEDEERPPQPEAPQEPVPKEKVKVCDIVDGILNENNGTTKVGECNPKDQGARYPGWNCTNPILVTKNGECMPPRRQKLCLFYLADINEQNKIHNQDDLRKAFIKTAAAETFLSWHYYKSKNSMDIKKLESGTIPEEFLRFMFYTYGDYRDICLDTDISAKTENGDITKAKDKIGKVFSNSDAKSPGNLSRQEWWDEHGKEIWKGMLCALSYDKTNKNMIENVRPQLTSPYNYDTIKNNLEDFAKTPQFLRWFTEWSDEFCREHKTQLESLKKKCPEDT